MKKLILVRHAKAGWTNPEHTDFDRPINPKGERDLAFLSNLLPEKISKPDLFLSSPAIRTKTTAISFAKGFGLDEKSVQFNEGIYERGSKYLINLLSEIDDKYQTVILFGHNPDMTSLASYFSGQYFDNVPTCGIVAIEFDFDNWKKIENTNGKLLFYEYPKKYF
jgi:phosphohistidine phosphatase